MKILFLSNIPAPYRVTFFNLLTKDNEVTVLFDKNNNENRNDKWFKDNEYLFNYIWLEKFSLFQLVKIIKKGEYDVVINGNYASASGAILAFITKLKKIPYIITADGGIIDDTNMIAKFLKKTFISLADYWLSTGKETNKYLTHYGAKEDKIFEFPFSSVSKESIVKEPITKEEKEKLRKKYKVDAKRVFISVGSFIERKGYDILLETIKEYNLKDMLFIFVGGGELLESYKKFIEDNNISNVLILDFLDKKELYDYYKMSDAFLFPTRMDIWGLVVNEAMAFGLPVVSTDMCVAANELIEKEYVYSVYDKKRMADIINEISEMSDEKLYQVGSKNLKTIENYTIESMTERHVEIFNEIVRKEHE